MIAVSNEAIAKAAGPYDSNLETSGKEAALAPSFTTAGTGKKIALSNEAIAKAAGLLGSNFETFGQDVALAPSFSTAGTGKKIAVSNEAIAKAAGLFGSSLETFGQDVALAPSFSTAGTGKKIAVSNEAIAKAAGLFGSSLETFGQDVALAPSFSTAGTGKMIAVSNEAMTKASDLFRDNNLNQHSTSPSLAFSTAAADNVSSVLNDNMIGPTFVTTIENGHDGSGRARQCVLHPSEEPPEAVSRVSIDSADLANQITYNTSALNEKSTTFADALRRGSFCTGEDEGIGVCSSTMAVTSHNATELRFDTATDLPTCFAFERLNTTDEHVVGSTADYRDSLVKRGYNCSSVTDKWIENNTRWIVWKLACNERRFSRWLGGIYLTFSRVVDQLARRFEKEILNGTRPVVRKILNRDATAACLMVLCVADIRFHVENSKKSYLLELTDGWYSIRCWPSDDHLYQFISEKRIRVGTKLLVSNASLIGAENGVDPNDSDYDAFGVASPTLKISANATRLARWNARLGQVYDKGSSPVGLLRVSKISDILEGGGNVPLIDLLVVKKYPMKYCLPKQSDQPDTEAPRIVSESDEAKRRMDYEKQRQALLESIHEEIRQECEKVCTALQQSILRVSEVAHCPAYLSGCRRECSGRLGSLRLSRRTRGVLF